MDHDAAQQPKWRTAELKGAAKRTSSFSSFAKHPIKEFGTGCVDVLNRNLHCLLVFKGPGPLNVHQAAGDFA
jgi:hypothetical protein